jgi:predicted flap endonuclease-1-like 5' DNA nuclease
MNHAEMKNGPHFEMWVIGIAAGLVAAAVMYVVGHYGFLVSGFVGALVALVVGAVFGMPKARVEPLPLTDVSDAHADGSAVINAGAPADAAPVAVTMPTPAMAEVAPASFVAMPADAKPARAPRAPAAAKPAKAAVTAAPAAAKPAKAAVTASAPAAEKPAKVAKPKKEDGPVRLKAARKGGADDLKEIEGIGPAMEKLVNGLGFYHFDQIAGWSEADVAWVDTNMKTFKGRIVRDKWVAQAKIIVAEGLDAFRIRAKTNDY